MTTTAPPPAATFGSAAGVRAARERVRAAEVEEASQVLAFALAHPPVDEADVAMHRYRTGPAWGTELVDLNAVSVPTVSAVAVAELGAALSISTEAARTYVADVLELAYRMPRTWQRTQDRGVPVWVARRVARATVALPDAGAELVDGRVGSTAGKVNLRAVDRLVQEALARFEPEKVLERQAREAEHRCLHVELDRTTLSGLVPVSGQVDLIDALALQSALNHGAAELKRLGSSESLDARRSRAIGDLAREHLSLWEQDAPDGRVVFDDVAGTVVPIEQIPGYVPRDPAGGFFSSGLRRECGPEDAVGGPGVGRPVSGRARSRASLRRVTLHVHLSAAALGLEPTSPSEPDRASGDADPPGGLPRVAGRPGDARRREQASLLGRVEDPHLPITAETIRAWCGQPHAHVTVLPVLDLDERLHHSAYEIPTRIREHVVARDVTCVFPLCERVARSCDLDHVVPFDHDDPTAGGPTSTENLAPLCRHHHRLKTTGRIRYRSPSPGVYEWTFPDGTSARRDSSGSATVPVSTRTGAAAPGGVADPARGDDESGTGPET